MIKKVNPLRLVTFGAIIILLAGTLCSVLFEDPSIKNSIFPNPEVSIPFLNALSLFFAVCLFIFPKFEFLCYIVLIPQIIATTMTGHETLGVFLYVLFLAILFFEQRLSYKVKNLFMILSLIIFLIVLLGVLPYGIVRFCMAFAETIFFVTTFLSFYISIKEKLNSLIPEINSKLYFSNDIKLPKSGEVVSLKEIGLTKRQSELLILFVTKDFSYTQLAQKTDISVSIIKKEMSDCLTIFGCRNIATLRIILSNFQLTY